jgi:cytochrome c2
MRRPSGKLILAFIVCMLIGYVASWLIMIFILKTEYRLYGFGNLSVVALLVAFILLLLLDSPLTLGLFKWDEAFWPEGVNLPERRAGQSRGVRLGNSFKVALFIVIVVGSIAGFASLIPQIESPAPETLEISGDLSGPELAALGEEIVNSADAGCLACHGLGREGLRAPDLAGIGGAAASREPGKSAEDYLYEALQDPCAYVVEGYDCIMPTTLAQALGPAKVTAVVAFLESQGGEITVSLSADEAASGAAEESSGGPGVAGATGEEIITNAAPTCSTCHQLDAIGAAGAIGPDLSQVGARLTPDEIRHSILMPDEVIAEECPGAPCAPGIMPKTYGEQLSAIQLETLVQFLSEQQ